MSADRPFHDVFISYRHHDSALVDGLEEKIRAAGFEPFRDLNFSDLANTAEVGKEKIARIRAQLQKTTCLIFAFSRESARQPGQGVGVWMPWELGFFDGALSSRIGVYLLDGPRDAGIEPIQYFQGCEYLQLYAELDERSLDGFLRRHAVRERRIDNVAAAFVWMQHMARESLANPLNVQLGVAEWWADHWARLWQTQGQDVMADAFAQIKTALDDLRVTLVPALRLPALDELKAPALPAMPPAAPGIAGLPWLCAFAPWAAPGDAAGAVSVAAPGAPRQNPFAAAGLADLAAVVRAAQLAADTAADNAADNAAEKPAHKSARQVGKPARPAAKARPARPRKTDSP